MTKRRYPVAVGMMALLAWSLAFEMMRADSFRASCVKVEITPEEPQWMHTFAKRMTTGVLDPLFHRVVVMHDGNTEFVLISSDLIGFTAAYYDRFCERLRETTGISSEQVWWTFTHTHSSPSMDRSGVSSQLKSERDFSAENTQYMEIVQSRLLEAIRQARSTLEPARLGIGQGKSLANYNRRSRDADGRINLGFNPTGPVDRRIDLLRLERADGSPIALIANYPIHGTVLGYYKNYEIGNTLISGDVPGIVARHVEEAIGAPMLFIQGAAGNIAPLYTMSIDHKRGHLTEFKVLLGDEILEANETIRDTSVSVELHVGERLMIESPLRDDIQWPEPLNRYLKVTESGQRMIHLPISFLRINEDIVIWAAPCELFCEIAMAVREASPFPHTMYFGYTNGTFGYIPTESAFAEGGYEPDKACVFTPRVERDITQGVLQYLGQMTH